MSTAEISTCTVVTGANMARCGAAAVASFTGRNGEAFGECADHVVEVASRSASGFEVGDVVTVKHCGATKVGVVRRIARTRVHVEVKIDGGKRSKVIVRDVVEVAAR